MAIESYTAQLERVQAAIAKIETSGQAYEISVDGSQRSMTRVNAEWLYKREAMLRPLAVREARGRKGFTVQQGIPR